MSNQTATDRRDYFQLGRSELLHVVIVDPESEVDLTLCGRDIYETGRIANDVEDQPLCTNCRRAMDKLPAVHNSPAPIATAAGVVIAEQRRINAGPELPEDLRRRVIAGALDHAEAVAHATERNDFDSSLQARLSAALETVEDLGQFAHDAGDPELSARLHAAYAAIEEMRLMPGRPQQP